MPDARDPHQPHDDHLDHEAARLQRRLIAQLSGILDQEWCRKLDLDGPLCTLLGCHLLHLRVLRDRCPELAGEPPVDASADGPLSPPSVAIKDLLAAERRLQQVLARDSWRVIETTRGLLRDSYIPAIGHASADLLERVDQAIERPSRSQRERQRLD